jgi:hypothetical protein
MDATHLQPGVERRHNLNHGHPVPEAFPTVKAQALSRSPVSSLHIPPMEQAVQPLQSAEGAPRRFRKKLILCFDGTGNKFKGDEGDSNILKIFRMLDRSTGDQCKRNLRILI